MAVAQGKFNREIMLDVRFSVVEQTDVSPVSTSMPEMGRDLLAKYAMDRDHSWASQEMDCRACAWPRFLVFAFSYEARTPFLGKGVGLTSEWQLGTNAESLLERLSTSSVSRSCRWSISSLVSSKC